MIQPSLFSYALGEAEPFSEPVCAHIRICVRKGFQLHGMTFSAHVFKTTTGTNRSRVLQGQLPHRTIIA